MQDWHPHSEYREGQHVLFYSHVTCHEFRCLREHRSIALDDLTRKDLWEEIEANYLVGPDRYHDYKAGKLSIFYGVYQ